jgi:hypothetical protein
LSGAILLEASPSRAEKPSKVECVAANEAGQVLVQSGKLTEAERKLATCMAASCPIPVREDCAQRLIDVGRAIPSVAFEWKDGAGNAVRPARVTMDGQTLQDALGGKPVRVDPGEHRFAFEADGQSPVEKTLTLREGEQGRKETIVFPGGPAAAVSDSARPSVPEHPPAEAHPAGDVATPPPSHGIPTLVYVAGGAAVVGLALGIGAGVAASSRNSALATECTGNACPPGAQQDIGAFRTWRDWSTAGYVLAAAGLVGGVVFWLAAPGDKAQGAAAHLWIGPRGAGVAGSF